MAAKLLRRLVDVKKWTRGTCDNPAFKASIPGSVIALPLWVNAPVGKAPSLLSEVSFRASLNGDMALKSKQFL